MSSQTVTASLRSTKPIRNYRVKIPLVENLPGSFEVKLSTGLKVFHFKDSDGRKANEFVIHGTKVFNLEDPIDKHNFNILSVWLTAFPDQSNEIVIVNPMEAAEKELLLQDIAFEIEGYIRKNKDNTEILGRLYRRLFKNASGIDKKIVYKTLREEARANPMRFKIGHKYIYEHEDFEIQSLIDKAREKGILTESEDGWLAFKEGTPLAESFEKAVFILKADVVKLDNLKYLIDSHDLKPQPIFDNTIQEPDYVTLDKFSDFGESIEEHAVNADFSSNEDDSQMELEAEISANIEKFIEKGFITKQVTGKKVRYSLHGVPAIEFRKEELLGHYLKNPSQYQKTKEEVSLT